MCLGVPMQIISVHGTDAVAEIDGVRREASLMLLDESVAVGDYVIVHAGFAITRLDEAEALETLDIMRQIFDPADMQ